MGYLTGDSVPQDTVCISLTVPDDRFFRMAVIGQLEELFQNWNWEKFGALTQDDMVNALKDLNPDFAEDCAMNCSELANCIETTPSAQTAINNTVINSGTINPNTINPETTTGSERFPTSSTEELKSPPAGCDKDVLWAGIREIVERLDQQGRDLLEDLQVINDKVEQMNNAIGAVPLLGSVLESVGDWFTETIPDLVNAYNSYSSPSTLDVIACDLFEIVCQDCRYPTFDEVFDYLVQRSAAGLPNFNVATYAQMWDVVKAVTVATPSIVWFTVNAWQAFTYGFGGTWNGSYGKKTFGIWASFGEDLPNNNWEVLCSGCADPDPCTTCPSPTLVNAGCLTTSTYPVTTGGNVGTTSSTSCGTVYIVQPGGSVEVDFEQLYCIVSVRVATGTTSGTDPNYGIAIYVDDVLQVESTIPTTGNNNFATNKTYNLPQLTHGQRVKVVNTGNGYWVHQMAINACTPNP